jgi:hypothetical protein
MVYVTDESARVIELRVDAPGEARVVAGSVPGFRSPVVVFCGYWHASPTSVARMMTGLRPRRVTE